MNDAAETPLNELVDRALVKMATGEWRMVLTHPNPAEGSSSCGTDVPREIAGRALAATLLTQQAQALADANARIREMEKALEPFALVAELDIGESETDDDLFRPVADERNALAKRLRVGDLRRARRARGGNNAD